MPLLGKFIKKIMNYGNFWVCKPPFLKPELRGCGPGNSSSTPNLKKIIQGDSSGKLLPKNLKFLIYISIAIMLNLLKRSNPGILKRQKI